MALQLGEIYSKAMATWPKLRPACPDQMLDALMKGLRQVRNIARVNRIMARAPNSNMPLTQLNWMGSRRGLGLMEVGAFVIDKSHFWEVYEHPVRRDLWARPTKKHLSVMWRITNAIQTSEHESIIRLQKVLLMTPKGRARLRALAPLSEELGFPRTFYATVLPRYKDIFQIRKWNSGKNRKIYIELLRRDPKLMTCAIDKYRLNEYRKGDLNEEDARFSFPTKFPPSYRLTHEDERALANWQKIPYPSPYADIRCQDLRSPDAKSRMAKRAVAVIHEFLSITVEKRVAIDKLARLKYVYFLPADMKDLLLRLQGIFYISYVGNRGTLLTILLREAYFGAELIEPNRIHLARKQLLTMAKCGKKFRPIHDTLALAEGQSTSGYGDATETMGYLREMQKRDASVPLLDYHKSPTGGLQLSPQNFPQPPKLPLLPSRKRFGKRGPKLT